jgi:hypothetical protein
MLAGFDAVSEKGSHGNVLAILAPDALARSLQVKTCMIRILSIFLLQRNSF